MADEEFFNSVFSRVTVICPESSKITESAKTIFVQDAIYEVKHAFSSSEEMIKLRAASYLASHYCALNLFQNSQAYSEEDFGAIKPGETGVSGAGAIKTNAYKDKKQEFFEKRVSDHGNALTKWTGEVPADMIPFTGTSYGQEYLRLFKQYVRTEPFIVGNNEDLGREPADYPGGRYRRW